MSVCVKDWCEWRVWCAYLEHVVWMWPCNHPPFVSLCFDFPKLRQFGGGDIVMSTVCYRQCEEICAMNLGQPALSVSLVKVGVSFLLFLVKRSQVVHPCPSLLLRRWLVGVGLEVMCSARAAEVEFDVETPCIAHPSQLAAAGHERSCHPVGVGFGARSAARLQFGVAGLCGCVLVMLWNVLLEDWCKKLALRVLCAEGCGGALGGGECGVDLDEQIRCGQLWHADPRSKALLGEREQLRGAQEEV